MAFDRVSQYGVDTMGRGAANMSALTVPRGFASSHVSPGAEVDEGDADAHPATGGNPLTFVFILLGLIVAMFFVHRSSSIIKGETFGVNWFTFLEVGVMATFFILLIKAIFGRWHVYGITPAVAAI
jgi:hypothetical protein